MDYLRMRSKIQVWLPFEGEVVDGLEEFDASQKAS